MGKKKKKEAFKNFTQGSKHWYLYKYDGKPSQVNEMQEVEQRQHQNRAEMEQKYFPDLNDPISTPKAAGPTSNLQLWTAHPPQLGAHRLHLLHQGHQDGVIDPLQREKGKIQAQEKQECLINSSSYPHREHKAV